MMNIEDQEFEAAAIHLDRCRRVFENMRMMNVPRDPVEREKSAVNYERARADLYNATNRMDRARVARYGGGVT